MKHRARLLIPTILGALLTGCAALPAIASIFGGAASAIDAIAAQQQRAAGLAPGATAADLAAIVARLDALDECDRKKAAVLAPDAGAAPTQALIDAAAALRGLTDAIDAARKSAAVGKDGGT